MLLYTNLSLLVTDERSFDLELIIKLESLTFALQARKLLARNGKRSKIRKLESLNGNGCGYGLVIENCDPFTLANILRGASISYMIVNEK